MSANAAVTLEQFPALAEMGVLRFHEISHYSLRQDGVSKDVLQVYYKRAKGSLLPFSRKYRFGRSARSLIADGGSSKMVETHEISPFLLRAVAELDRLVAENRHVDVETRDAKESFNRKSELLVELNHVDRMLGEQLEPAAAALMASKFDHIRRLVDNL